MDEYEKEIRDVQREIERLVEAEGDAGAIRELEMQVQVLIAICAQAHALLKQGDTDPDLRSGLAMRGYGPWNLDNVYAFVYESAVDMPAEGHNQFVKEVSHTDFADLLQAHG
jgi:hypothetical protein